MEFKWKLKKTDPFKEGIKEVLGVTSLNNVRSQISKELTSKFNKGEINSFAPEFYAIAELKEKKEPSVPLTSAAKRKLTSDIKQKRLAELAQNLSLPETKVLALLDHYLETGDNLFKKIRIHYLDLSDNLFDRAANVFRTDPKTLVYEAINITNLLINNGINVEYSLEDCIDLAIDVINENKDTQDLEPFKIELYFNLGYFQLLMGDLAEAVINFSKAKESANSAGLKLITNRNLRKATYYFFDNMYELYEYDIADVISLVSISDLNPREKEEILLEIIDEEDLWNMSYEFNDTGFKEVWSLLISLIDDRSRNAKLCLIYANNLIRMNDFEKAKEVLEGIQEKEKYAEEIALTELKLAQDARSKIQALKKIEDIGSMNQSQSLMLIDAFVKENNIEKANELLDEIHYKRCNNNLRFLKARIDLEYFRMNKPELLDDVLKQFKSQGDYLHEQGEEELAQHIYQYCFALTNHPELIDELVPKLKTKPLQESIMKEKMHKLIKQRKFKQALEVGKKASTDLQTQSEYVLVKAQLQAQENIDQALGTYRSYMKDKDWSSSNYRHILENILLCYKSKDSYHSLGKEEIKEIKKIFNHLKGHRKKLNINYWNELTLFHLSQGNSIRAKLCLRNGRGENPDAITDALSNIKP